MAIIKIRNAAIDLDAAEIPNLPATKITSGTLADARIPANALNSNVDLTNLSASNLTSGSIPTARITALPSGVGGKVLQVVSDNTSDYNQSNTSTTHADIKKSSSSWETAITPSATSSKIYVNVVINFNLTGSDAQKRMSARVMGKIGSGSYSALSDNGFSGLYAGSAPDFNVSAPFSFLWSPNTTNECKIKLQFKLSYTNSNMTVYINPNTTNHTSVTLMEVAG